MENRSTKSQRSFRKVKVMFPKVVQAITLQHGIICVYFEDGAIREYDVRPLLRPNTVFEPLMGEETFRDCLTVLNDTASWDLTGKRDPMDCIDIDSDTLYNAKSVPDPLEMGIGR